MYKTGAWFCPFFAPFSKPYPLLKGAAGEEERDRNSARDGSSSSYECIRNASHPSFAERLDFQKGGGYVMMKVNLKNHKVFNFNIKYPRRR